MTANDISSNSVQKTRRKINHHHHHLILLFTCCYWSWMSCGVRGQEICPSPNTAIMGFPTLKDLNMAMEEKLAEIDIDDTQMYDFILCPDLVYDASVTMIRPIVNANISCGTNTDFNCTISGGETQVLIEETTRDGYNFSGVTFNRFVFTDFTSASIAAYADNSTLAYFTFCNWENFNSTTGIDIANQNNPESVMSVLMDYSGIFDAAGGVFVINEGGVFDAFDCIVVNANMMSFCDSSFSANTFLTRVDIVQSSFEFVTYAESDALTFATDWIVDDNINLKEIFYGESSIVALDEVIVINNNIPDEWGVVHLNNTSIGVITNLYVANNTNMREGIDVNDFSFAQIENVVFEENIAFADIGALILASGGFVDVVNGEFNNNYNYTATVFGIYGSRVNVTTSCIVGGSNDATFFISSDTDHFGEENFISNHETISCSEGDRLFKENDGSTCFQPGGGTCSGVCEEFFTAASCAVPAPAPTPNPISCGNSNPCPDEYFCNFDDETSGFCEPCGFCNAPDGCTMCGLPDFGVTDCVESCSNPTPSITPPPTSLPTPNAPVTPSPTPIMQTPTIPPQNEPTPMPVPTQPIFCGHSRPCPNGYFCNFDDGTSGFCEPCGFCNAPDGCAMCGLPDFGLIDCVESCSNPTPSPTPYWDEDGRPPSGHPPPGGKKSGKKDSKKSGKKGGKGNHYVYDEMHTPTRAPVQSAVDYRSGPPIERVNDLYNSRTPGAPNTVSVAGSSNWRGTRGTRGTY